LVRKGFYLDKYTVKGIIQVLKNDPNVILENLTC